MACSAMKKNVKNGPPKTLVPKLEDNDDTIITLTNCQLNFKREIWLLTTAHGADMVDTRKIDHVTKEVIMKL